MKISMIAAMAHNRVIGQDNQMPWHLPADLKHFKQVTMGKPVIMGRKTYESIGRALPGRLNVVISRSESVQVEDGVVLVSSPEAALEVVANSEEVMVIGGGHIYQLLLPQAQELHLTFIDLEVQGDTQFPDYEAQGQWRCVSRESCQPDEKNPYHYQFVHLLRQ